MTKTVNAYKSDQGELVVTISSANVTAIAAFTTAEDITLDGALRYFRRTNNPQRNVSQTRVTGDLNPIVTRSSSKPEAELWEIGLVDDYYAGNAGEWGTDSLSAVEIFKEMDEADQDPGGIAGTPAGGATGDIEITLVNPVLLGLGVPEIDADAQDPNEIPVYLAADSHTTAAHA